MIELLCRPLFLTGFLITFPGKACLQSGAGGAALAGTLPLGRDRTAKLFRLREVGLPPHSLRPWPLRCVLRCDAAGGAYLSASGRALAAAAPVRLARVLDLPGVQRLLQCAQVCNKPVTAILQISI